MRDAIAATSLSSMIVLRVTSRPIAITGAAPTPPKARKTIRPASASCQMLNSAEGVTLPEFRIGAAHDDEPLDEARQFGLAHDGERDIRQRAHRAQDEAPGMRARRADDRIRGMQRVRRLLRLRQNRMAKAGLAVNFARVPRGNGNRSRRARPDWDIRSPRKRENSSRIARCGGERNIADDRGDAEDTRPVIRAGVEQRKRIVDASIDVKDERLSESRT